MVGVAGAGVRDLVDRRVGDAAEVLLGVPRRGDADEDRDVAIRGRDLKAHVTEQPVTVEAVEVDPSMDSAWPEVSRVVGSDVK
jgi:hypothetical protein